MVHSAFCGSYGSCNQNVRWFCQTFCHSVCSRCSTFYYHLTHRKFTQLKVMESTSYKHTLASVLKLKVFTTTKHFKHQELFRVNWLFTPLPSDHINKHYHFQYRVSHLDVFKVLFLETFCCDLHTDQQKWCNHIYSIFFYKMVIICCSTFVMPKDVTFKSSVIN